VLKRRNEFLAASEWDSKESGRGKGHVHGETYRLAPEATIEARVVRAKTAVNNHAYYFDGNYQDHSHC